MFSLRGSLSTATRLVAAAGGRAAPVSARCAASSAGQHKIVYTYTDEAPMLATYSLLPIIRRFTDAAGIAVELSDISVAARILALFPERLKPEQRVPDNLAALGELCKKPEANIIKLPNVSASLPQLQAAIAELKSQGYDLPDYPAAPKTDGEKDIQARYAKVLGSAVNPVIREGNSDRRAAAPVKEYAKKNPKKLGPWTKDIPTHVAYMKHGDFFGNEHSFLNSGARTVDIVHVDKVSGKEVVLKSVKLEDKEVMDSTFMNVRELVAYVEREIAAAKDSNILLSLHLKATMMKVSDPIMFGHVVKVFFKDVFAKHAALFKSAGINANNGLGDVYEKLKGRPELKEVEADIKKQYETRPRLAMVDSSKGITNLHVPSDVIVDASMPCVVRDSGCMWNADNKLEATKCLIPDRSYATFYDAVFEDCRAHGAFNPATMGHVSNVGLMAQKAEEYGSHDKTFEVASTGKIRIVDKSTRNVLSEHDVEKGDIWRACTVKDPPVKAWVGLAISRARASGAPAIFWLDSARAHDRVLIGRVKEYLKEHDLKGISVSIKSPVDAVKESMARARRGEDTISVTGNVLRDYLTDLFPILELGTSARMLSIVPLLAGGGLFETGAGGSAPKHVQQFTKENHLRWDSLGEYLAMAVSLEELGHKTNNKRALQLGETLTEATGQLLEKRKGPSIKVKEIDNRGSSYYIARYWAEAMAKRDPAYKDLAKGLADNEAVIVKDLIDCQGVKVDIGGYYHPDPKKTERAMRPSATLNKLIAKDF